MKILSKLILVFGVFTLLYAYEPPLKEVEVNGVKIHVLADDEEEALEEGMIDQFWLAQAVKEGKVPNGVHFVDLRSLEKFKTEHIEGAINAPYDRDSESMDKSKFPKDGIVVFYCDTGIKSMEARTSLDEDEASRFFVFDMAYRCDKDNKNCNIVPNSIE